MDSSNKFNHVVCSLLLAVIKFGFDKREPKGCCLLVEWLVCSTART